MNDNYTTITKLEVKGKYRYVWLKYVDGFNLLEHCAKSLVGNYSKLVNKATAHYSDLLLNEFDSKIYYLCGVSEPYEYDRNIHIAFIHKKGASFTFSDGTIDIEVQNAMRLPFGTYSINRKDPLSQRKEYATCRNWQFANELCRITN